MPIAEMNVNADSRLRNRVECLVAEALFETYFAQVRAFNAKFPISSLAHFQFQRKQTSLWVYTSWLKLKIREALCLCAICV